MSEWQQDTLVRLKFLWENMVLASSQDGVNKVPRIADTAFVEARNILCGDFDFEAALENPNSVVPTLTATLSRVPHPSRDMADTINNVQNAVNLHKRWRRGRDDLARMMEDKERGWEHFSVWPDTIDRIVEDIWGNPVALGYLARKEGMSVTEDSPAIDDEFLEKVYDAFSSLDDHIDSQMDTGTHLHQSKTPAVKYQRMVLAKIARTCNSFQLYCSAYDIPLLLRFISLFARCPFYANLLSFSELVEVFRCVRNLPDSAKNILKRWYVHCPLSVVESQVDLVRLMFTISIMNDEIPQQYLSDVIGPTVRHGITYLDIIYKANKEREQLQLEQEMTVAFYARKLPFRDLASDSLKPLKRNSLPLEEFHCDGINQRPLMLMTDFSDFGRGLPTTYGLLDHPFVLDAASKSQLLKWDSAQQQRAESRRGALSFGPLAFLSPYLVLEVRRRNLVEDALNQLTRYGSRRMNSFRLKKPLKVVFAGEDGVDEGGVAKEFFQLLVEQLFNPDYGMFAYYPETRYFWFRKDSFEAFVQFELIGIVLGLALYNNIILDIHFPPVVYKKLLSGSPSMVPPPTQPTTSSRSPPNPTSVGGGAAASSPQQASIPAGGGDADVSRRNVEVTMPPPEGSSNTGGGGSSSSSGSRRSAESGNGGAPQFGGLGELLGMVMRHVGISQDGATNEEGQRPSPASVFGAVSELTSGGSGGDSTEQDIVAVMARSLPSYKPCLEDLEDFEPQLVKSLRQLLMAPPDTVESMCLTFSVDVEQFGVVNSVPLPRENRQQSDAESAASEPEDVTAENREEYVRALLRYYLVDSIAPQFNAFYKGFHRCCGSQVLRLFDPADLNLVICGCPEDLNFEELEKCVEYQDGYTADSPVIRMFWEIVHAMSQQDKKRLLFFITGSDRTPVKGLASMKLVIGRAGGEKNRLPSAHTCYNHLMLPEYDSKEKMQSCLTKALEYRHGFGLR